MLLAFDEDDDDLPEEDYGDEDDDLAPLVDY